jgi:hypothetical protein
MGSSGVYAHMLAKHQRLEIARFESENSLSFPIYLPLSKSCPYTIPHHRCAPAVGL